MITLLLSIVFLVLQGFGINVIQDWQAILWAGVLEILVEFFYVFSLHVGDYKMKIQELLPEIEITNVSNEKKFICFRIKGLKDGIIVGLTHPELPLNDPKQGLSVGYKGEVKKVCFKNSENNKKFRPKRKRNFTKKQWDIIYLLWQNLTPEQIIKQCPEYNMNQIKRVLYWLYI